MGALVLALAVAVAFAFTNGIHDASNSIAALVATKAARPGQAVVLAAFFHILGPLVAGAAVADTVGGIVTVSSSQVLPVVGAGLTAGLTWNLLTWWRGLPSSSSHALVGGLVGAALVEGGWQGVRWGGLEHGRPVGVLGVLIVLAVSPLLGYIAGFLCERLGRRCLRRANRDVVRPLRHGEWVTSSALAFSHGTNDTQKTIGVMTLLLVATHHLSLFAAPLWVKLLAAGSMTLGTSLGGWRIVRTVGRGIYRIRTLDGLASQTGSTAVILSATAIGGPVSTTHVVASSVMGVGSGRRLRHVRWNVVGEIALAWVVALPATVAGAAAVLPLWRLA